MTTKNDITGDELKSKASTDKFRDNWDSIFNPCDGCERGTPIVNGIHKDEQDLGMACSKSRYGDFKDNVKLGVSPSTDVETWVDGEKI